MSLEFRDDFFSRLGRKYGEKSRSNNKPLPKYATVNDKNVLDVDNKFVNYFATLTEVFKKIKDPTVADSNIFDKSVTFI